jgi:hypothetical protein
MHVADSFKERRRHKRIPFEAPATITADHHTIPASTKNISERGLFFLTDAQFEVRSAINVAFTLPERWDCRLLVCCHGRVVRSDFAGGQYGLAVEIDRLAPVPQV